MTRRQVAEFFDGHADAFDAIYGNRDAGVGWLVNRLLRRSMRLRFEAMLSSCAPVEGRTVLDVGCGPGRHSVALARRGAARVVGVDFAPRMVELARAHAEEAGVAERCTFVVGDVLDLALPEAFDFVVVLGVMDYVAEPRAFLRRVLALARVRTVVSLPAAGGPLAWQRRVRYRRRCPLFLYREAELRELLEDLAPGRHEVRRMARDFFVTVEAG